MNPLPVVVNRHGGHAQMLGARLEPTVRAAFAAAGLAIDLHLVDGGALEEQVRTLSGALGAGGVIAVGGGDGSLRTAASILVETGGVLAPLPLGTKNHLYHTLYGQRDLKAAAAGIAAGKQRSIDLGSVNGQIFLNNASLGIYPRLVAMRDHMRTRHHWSKPFANLVAGARLLSRMPNRRVRLEFSPDMQPSGQGSSGHEAPEHETPDHESGPMTLVTPLLFVGNNLYALTLGKVGTRPAMDQGELSVLAAGRRSLWGHIWNAARTLVGHGEEDKGFALYRTGRGFVAHTSRSRAKIALDGEVLQLKSPLQFAIRPLALRVIA